MGLPEGGRLACGRGRSMPSRQGRTDAAGRSSSPALAGRSQPRCIRVGPRAWPCHAPVAHRDRRRRLERPRRSPWARLRAAGGPPPSSPRTPGELGVQAAGATPARRSSRERLIGVTRVPPPELPAVVVLKGDDTLIADPGAWWPSAWRAIPRSRRRAPGDVLTGVIAALLAQGLARSPRPPRASGCTRVPASGRRAALGASEGVIASDVIAALPRARPRWASTGLRRASAEGFLFSTTEWLSQPQG